MPDVVSKLAPSPVINEAGRDWEDLSLREVLSGELCSLSAHNNKAAETKSVFADCFGAKLPEPGFVDFHGTGFVFWTSPHQWMVRTDNTNPFEDLSLFKQFKNCASVTLQTDAWTEIEVSGPAAGRFFERVFSIDTSIENFPPASAARTQAHHVNVFILHMPGKSGTYRMMCARSYAQSLWDTLTKIADGLLGHVPN